MPPFRSHLAAALLGLAGAMLLRAGVERLAPALPWLARAATGLALGGAPLACLVWEGSEGRPTALACVGWRDGRLEAAVEAWRRAGG